MKQKHHNSWDVDTAVVEASRVSECPCVCATMCRSCSKGNHCFFFPYPRLPEGKTSLQEVELEDIGLIKVTYLQYLLGFLQVFSIYF